MGPITAPEFVRGALARGITLPRGHAWRRWAEAVTGGLVSSDDCATFLRIAAELDALATRPPAGALQH